MEHRNQVILRKVLSEIDIASQFLSDCTLEEFVADELMCCETKPNRLYFE